MEGTPTITVTRASNDPEERDLKDPELTAFRNQITPLIAADSTIEDLAAALALEYAEVELSDETQYVWKYDPDQGWVRICIGEQTLVISDGDMSDPFVIRFRTVVPL